jgi:glycosyltransferase involved in cell wall biosynthesis
VLATVATRASGRSAPRDAAEGQPQVCVACPDARQPAYEAAAGLHRVGSLQGFLTAHYHDEHSLPARLLASRPALARLASRSRRRSHAGLPADRVIAHPWVDLALAGENHAGSNTVRRGIARFRTQAFDRVVARHIGARRPEVVLGFSDVGSVHVLDRCRRLGIPYVLSVVHGDVDDEVEILDRQRAERASYFPIYLGDGQLDRELLDWLHARRRREARLADLLLVPSEHIAGRFRAQGIAPDRIRVIPYAADLGRFRPRSRPADASGCTFVFAGGIAQRKGISYLLDAWDRIRRDEWTLRLIGPLPNRLGPLADRLASPGLEWVGRVGHSDMPDALAGGDVFVFPSLFEGSAVVTYEALACGLPSIVTTESGAVARDGIEGVVVPAADAEALARAMERLGTDQGLRVRMGAAARRRAEEFSWSRYHADVARAAGDVHTDRYRRDPAGGRHAG